MKDQHQGKLTVPETEFLKWMKANPGRWWTSWEICENTGCVSARDKMRKFQANGVPIGPAKILRTNEDGTRIFGWRVAR